MEDLVRGQELAKQVHIQLQGSEIPVGLKDSVARILECFANAVSKFSSGESTGEVCQTPALTAVDSPSPGCRKSGGTGQIRSIATPNKSGANKRRKTSDARVKLTETPLDDGRTWRKYGQKEILNSRFPRSYFRCTHKTGQGCQATKQVQRTEEPEMYHVTYIGQHTCKDQLKGPWLIPDSNTRDGFRSNYCSPKLEFPFSPSSGFAGRDDVPTAFNSSQTTSVMPSTSGSELVEGISGVYSSAESDQEFDMGILLEDVLHFDPTDFYRSSLRETPDFYVKF